MEARIFSIEEFSVYDGPGIRTTVFLKGCPLRCSWCHNPEGQSFEEQIVKSPNGCINCGNCIKYAKTCDGQFEFTQDSIKNCPIGLLRVCGEKIDSKSLCKKLLKNQNLLQNGGVTFSGGEPLCQSSFLLECLDELHGKLHTAIQTSGYCETEIFDKVIDKADYFLFDLKLADDAQHIKYTGVSNKLIHKNFSLLAKSSKDFVVRVPLIPTVTDTDDNILGIVGLLKENNVNYLELLPYNKMAGGKYALVGKKYAPDFDEQQEINIPSRILTENGIEFKVL